MDELTHFMLFMGPDLAIVKSPGTGKVEYLQDNIKFEKYVPRPGETWICKLNVLTNRIQLIRRVHILTDCTSPCQEHPPTPIVRGSRLARFTQP